MKINLYLFLFSTLFISFFSCKEEPDLSPQLAGLWKQDQLIVDDVEQSLNVNELNTSLLLEINGVYRLFDGVTGTEHVGTWLFSDVEWLNMSMDKIQGTVSPGNYKFGQVLVRFTILHVDATTLELRIRTYLYERKKTVMFNLMEQDDTTGMTGEQLLTLDTENKKMHTYRYIFKKVNL